MPRQHILTREKAVASYCIPIRRVYHFQGSQKSV